MRQVPEYCVVGRGRLATHLTHYMTLLGLSYVSWHRGQSHEQFQIHCKQVAYVFLCIPDDAVEDFIRAQGERALASVTWVHFSGALQTDLAYGVHPLMTFGTELYPLSDYQAIPFVCTDDVPGELLSIWPNPCYSILAEKKALYHAWCVLAGNGSAMLWQRFMAFMQQELGLPEQVVIPFARQSMANVLASGEEALTGPMIRGDHQTLAGHEQALAQRSELPLYQAFYQWFLQGENGENS